MDISVLGAASDAIIGLADPFRLFMLGCGVLFGLFLGIVPGIGGLAGMALLLPFTFTMDSYAAFAMLLGMSAVTGTSDTIPAVLFGVPGTAGAQATVMDGNPMAKKGEAGRALSAAFTSSLFGGLVGALLLALTVPVLRPFMLYIGSPELLGFSVFGIAMVAVLSGSAPLRGLVAAGIGVMISMIGADPQTGTLRYTMGSFYLWDGLPIVPLVLGLFALPELADLAIKRSAIASETKYDTRKGMSEGFHDALKNWWLVLRGGGLGAGVGAIPGLGSSVVDWIAYGWAFQSTKDADKTFGKGDVRGVIAPEAANNAITAGSLVPTIAFGVPGSASMAILLSVFLIHGLVPGPEMLTTNLDVTYSMVWSIAIANILGAGLCFLFSGQLAKIAVLRYTLILPAVLIFVYVGAFQSSRNWGDLYALLIFAVVGWVMKQLRWPRPPLVLGFVLGALIERYMFISTTRYGFEWMLRPLVIVLFTMAAIILAGPLIRHIRALGGFKGIVSYIGAPRLEWSDLLYLGVLALAGVMVVEALQWPWGAKVGPLSVGIMTLSFCVFSFLNQVFTRSVQQARAEAGEIRHEVHMDTAVDHGDATLKIVAIRAARFFAFLVLFIAMMALVGLIPTVPLFVAVFMRIEGREKWRLIAGYAVTLTLIVYLVFDQLLRIPWPQTFLGQWFPAMTIIPSV
ncbi:tripartite tricarboxylate transporter permease [Nitratireductor kimnyeongensis]|uniref:Tripartite tricarboxylate transporter permease n=1 Tax=Nitratireductor kimnyeongensis TaxID=430679 RepID=A0ABW0T6G8_9HYPH|nr:tripartite tricarboxylate transporter permease [Nitratireductor kimnyeongensis]QZZ34809.1 tripartite tricarboxylate transporter permease [Nitratireductor kimnyeongensis]